MNEGQELEALARPGKELGRIEHRPTLCLLPCPDCGILTVTHPHLVGIPPGVTTSAPPCLCIKPQPPSPGGVGPSDANILSD